MASRRPTQHDDPVPPNDHAEAVVVRDSRRYPHGGGREGTGEDVDKEEKGSGKDFDRVLVLCEKLSLEPSKKLLIFDLNGLLICRVHVVDRARAPQNRAPDAKYGTRYVYKRPFVEEFMKFCLERFEVGIWSSAQEHNVDGVLECAFKGLKSRFLFVWDQANCSDYGFKSLNKKDKPLFFKELKKVWEQRFDHPESTRSTTGHRFSASTTLLIDDSPYKALLNPPHTAIFPNSYDPADLKDNGIDPKEKLGVYLDGLAAAEDVQSYVKAHPYGQKPVGPDHQDWSFYSTVLRHVRRGLSA